MTTQFVRKRHERGQWIIRVRAWWRRNGWSAVLACIVFALGTAAIMRIGAIYAPNPNVPFLSAISAVRG